MEPKIVHTTGQRERRAAEVGAQRRHPRGVVSVFGQDSSAEKRFEQIGHRVKLTADVKIRLVEPENGVPARIEGQVPARREHPQSAH
jgi:hypothetical protein